MSETKRRRRTSHPPGLALQVRSPKQSIFPQGLRGSVLAPYSTTNTEESREKGELGFSRSLGTKVRKGSIFPFGGPSGLLPWGFGVLSEPGELLELGLLLGEVSGDIKAFLRPFIYYRTFFPLGGKERNSGLISRGEGPTRTGMSSTSGRLSQGSPSGLLAFIITRVLALRHRHHSVCGIGSVRVSVPEALIW